MPLDSPSRTDASHELLRTEPLHVKLREWLCVTPPLNLKSCAAPPCERSVCASPPPLLMSTAGAELVRVFDEKATFELPVTAPMCAWPSQLLASLDRIEYICPGSLIEPVSTSPETARTTSVSSCPAMWPTQAYPTDGTTSTRSRCATRSTFANRLRCGSRHRRRRRRCRSRRTCCPRRSTSGPERARRSPGGPSRPRTTQAACSGAQRRRCP